MWRYQNITLNSERVWKNKKAILWGIVLPFYLHDMWDHKSKISRRTCSFSKINYALSTLPDLKQLVQTCILLVAPFTLHFTLLTFEFQIALDLLWEWLTLFPKWTPLPQISHFAIVSTSLTKLSHSTHNISILPKKYSFCKLYFSKRVKNIWII